MEREDVKKKQYGLIGKNISYSFSAEWFTEKFKKENLHHCHYRNFDLNSIKEFSTLSKEHPDLHGLNVTIPYKEEILPYLNRLEGDAIEIGAANTLKPDIDGWIGYNTDGYGFKNTLIPLLSANHKKALVLGSGGAAKAVIWALEQLGITVQLVSRQRDNHKIAYLDLNKKLILDHQIIVNATPLGTYPNINEKPPIPYEFLNNSHLLFDLVYNPGTTTFMQCGLAQGAAVTNGRRMLELQAERAWHIWNS